MLNPQSSVADAGDSAPLKSTFQASSYVVSKSLLRVRCHRVKLPQVESPLLTREDPADEHNLDYVGKFELLVHQGLDVGLESGRISFFTPSQARLLPGGEPRRGSGSELGGCDPFRVLRLGDVKLP